MNRFKSLKTYFSAIFLALFALLFVSSMLFMYVDYSRSYSAYQADLDKRVMSFIAPLDSQSQDNSAEITMNLLLAGFEEISYVKYDDIEKELIKDIPDLISIESFLFSLDGSRQRGLAHNDNGVYIVYEYHPEFYVADFRPVFFKNLGLLAVVIILLSVFYILSLQVVKPIVRVKNAALQVTKGGVAKVDVQGKDEVAMLSMFFNEVVDSLQNVSSDLDERERLRGELNLASRIQNNLVPKQAPIVPGLDIALHTQSAAEIGGDVFDFISEDGDLLFFIGDATGHGVPAGLVMTMTDILVHTLRTVWTDLKMLTMNMNRILYDRTDPTMFITFVIMQYDFANKVFHYCGAGHEQILVYRAKTQTIDVITPGGIAVGMMPEIENLLKPNNLKLEEGDVFLLFTDGLVEARNAEGELYGLDRAKEAFAVAAKRDSSDKIIRKLFEHFNAFVSWEGYVQEDDISAIIVRQKADNEVASASLAVSS